MSTPFVAIDNKALTDHAYNLSGKTTGDRTRLHTVSRLTNWMLHMFTLATVLFFIVPPNILKSIGWQYIGGGAEYEKIHIATYLLIAAFVCLWLIDPPFRGNVTRLCRTDGTLISFAIAVGAIAFYAIIIKQVSITPFVDTFFAALLVAIGWICLPLENLRRLRCLLDIVLVTSIAIMLLEYGFQSHLIPHEHPDINGFRPDAFFGNALLASIILGVYSIANFASVSIKFTWACLIRLTLGTVSLFAIFVTGSRTAMITAVLILFAFLAFSAMRQVMSGRINRAAVVYGFLGFPVVAILVVVTLQLGMFDTILGRFEYDMGSAEARAIALDLVWNMPTSDLWFGMSSSDIRAFTLRQEEMDLTAIEISWANFVLACGLVFTVPLFATYSLFLVRFLPRYSATPAVLPAVFLIVVTASSNGIWAKTTMLTTSFALILAFFREPSSETSILQGVLLRNRRARMEC